MAATNGYAPPAGVVERVAVVQPVADEGHDLAATDSAAETLFAGAPSPEQLAAAVERADALLKHQDAPQLLAVKSEEELDAARAVAAEHRAAQLEVTRERNRGEVELATLEHQAALELAKLNAANALAQAKRQAKLDEELQEADHDLQRDVAKAGAEQRRLASPTGYLATLYRLRKAALICVGAPGVVGVLLGTENAQHGWSRVGNLEMGDALYWLLYGFEPLATLPLVGILLYMARPPAPFATDEVEERAAAKREKLGWIAVGLLLLSIVIQVLPHLILNDSNAAMSWAWVPIGIVLSFHLVAKLARLFGEKLKAAHAEAALRAPAGGASELSAKVARQLGRVLRAELKGTIGGERDEHGLPSNNQVYKAIREAGPGSREDAKVAAPLYRAMIAEAATP